MDQLQQTLFIFTTSPAGLGHIRVMDAIKDGQPGHINSVELGVMDLRANRIHDLGSRIKAFTKLTEFYQTNPLAERIVTFFFARYLKRHTQKIKSDFENIAVRYPGFTKWAIISTHFSLAYPILAIKEKLEKELGIKIYLCVIVTDDSPQRIWAVNGADIIFVPSIDTKDKLYRFLPPDKHNRIVQIPFPIVPRLTQNLSIQEFQFLTDQLHPNKRIPPQILVPISGAAVQLDYFEKLLRQLSQKNFQFTVIGQESFLTQAFFEKINRFPRIQLSIGADSWQTVNFYESIFYQPNRPSIEITKPSEQAFKAILNPRQRGGIILLLTHPIGRQEYDNLNFLRRFGLMPTLDEGRMLMRKDVDLRHWLEKAKSWRAIRIPNDPVEAAVFIENLKSSGILYNMLSCVVPNKPELKPNGVAQIWEEISKLINSQLS